MSSSTGSYGVTEWLNRQLCYARIESNDRVAGYCEELLRLVAGGWRDIATAPRDGTLIWVACEFCMRIASWSEYRWRDFHGEYPRLDVLFTPTHWQPLSPLPAPPEEHEHE